MLKRRMILLSILSVLFLLAVVFVFLQGKDADFTGEEILFPAAVAGICFGAAGSCLEKKKLKEAQLIIENRILYEKSTDVSISCFGVFMARKIIGSGRFSTHLWMRKNSGGSPKFSGMKREYRRQSLCKGGTTNA